LYSTGKRKPGLQRCPPDDYHHRGETLMPDRDESKGLTRRRVLTGAAGLAAGAGVGAAVYSAWRNSTYLFLLHQAPTHADRIDPEWKGSRVRQYRPLGATGIEMSDISFGGGGIGNPDVVALAVERGINYFDTSPDYSETGSEQVIGQALKPHRKKVFI